jgi:hypothetical protein
MNTARGATLPIMDTFGYRLQSESAGLLIAMDTGFGSARGAGRGLKTSLGDMLPSTMAAGFTTTIIGDGRLGQSTFVLIIHPRWSPGSVARAGA